MATNAGGEIMNRKDDFEEIKLIDDIPQSDFASEQDLLLWLCTGNKAIKQNGHIFGFKDGNLWDFTACKEFYWNSQKPEYFKKHTPPRLIRVNGIEAPAPLESLDGQEYVYLPNLAIPKKPIELKSSVVMTGCYSLDICYATKEDATKRAEAMLKHEVVD